MIILCLNSAVEFGEIVRARVINKRLDDLPFRDRVVDQLASRN
jgi:hypothetical protein